MNNQGEVVGQSSAPDGTHAVLWKNGTIIDLGVGNTAFAINNSGQILLGTPNGTFLWTDGQLSSVGCNAYKINERGDAVGRGLGSASDRACFWRDGVAIDLGGLGPKPNGVIQSAAFGVNNRREVVGFSSSQDGDRAFLWKEGQMISLGILGPYPGGYGSGFSSATGISGNGFVVGSSSSPQGPRAFLWQSEEGLMNLGMPPDYPSGQSQAIAVNNRGEVVGLASKYPVKPPRQVAFIWDPMHGMRELGRLIPENSGWGILFQVADINEGGQIIGNDKYQGRELGYLLTPSVSEEP
jgi:probable HAF family extracellular repeat protein